MRADEILESTSRLAGHLRRSGVLWLPAAGEDAVRQLADSFASSDADDAAARDASPRSSDSSRGPVRRPSMSESSARRPTGSALLPALGSVPQSYPGDPLPPDDRGAHLKEAAGRVAGCTRCPELVACRKQTVFGEGNLQPRFAFFGEGPGADEDRTGRPFVGRAGQLLTKMIEACKLTREEVYILNTVKCRPPGNRNPEANEVENCREYFEDQLSTLRPEYIVCLGAIAAQSLLRSKLSVGRLRGGFHRYFDSKVIVTYHPAYLLRNPSAKKAAWEDLQLMLRDAGISLTSGK